MNKVKMYRVQMKNSACVSCVHLLNFHLEAPFSRYISFLNICRDYHVIFGKELTLVTGSFGEIDSMYLGLNSLVHNLVLKTSNLRHFYQKVVSNLYHEYQHIFRGSDSSA